MDAYAHRMAPRHLLINVADGPTFDAAADRLRADLKVPVAFSDEVLAEAQSAAVDVRLPATDLTHLPFVSIDPQGSRDIDQAMHLEETSAGYRVHYAIADVGSFVRPGGEIDAESRRRGLTLYSPDSRAPMLPPILSEDAASLVAGQVRPACVWTIELDAFGEGVGVEVRRAAIRNREQLSFVEAQERIDAGTDPMLGLLAEIGGLRVAREQERGGVSLTIPEQEVEPVDGGYALTFRHSLPVESWNAQISLMAGGGAAELMLYAEIGVLRTMPAPRIDDVSRLRRVAQGLGVSWPPDQGYAQFLSGLDVEDPRHLAVQAESMVLVRGAGYSSFDGGIPELATHSAVGQEYAHCTAPLRRLVDRYVAQTCLSICADQDVPAWVREALPQLPSEMASAERRASALENAGIALMEALVLADRVGEVFSAVVIDSDDGVGTVQLADPAVRARCDGDNLPLGRRIDVRLTQADPMTRTVRFTAI